MFLVAPSLFIIEYNKPGMFTSQFKLFKRMASMKKSAAEWNAILTPEQFRVLRENGTERPFTNAFWKVTVEGEYQCAGCKSILFTSKDKFTSDCGWHKLFWNQTTRWAWNGSKCDAAIVTVIWDTFLMTDLDRSGRDIVSTALVWILPKKSRSRL